MTPDSATPLPVACPVIYTDTETTGLTPPHLPGGRRIWEVAVIRREIDRTERHLQFFIRLADLDLLEQIPPELAAQTALPLADRLQMLPTMVLDALGVGDFFHRHPEVNPTAPGAVVSRAQAADLLMDGWLTATPGCDAPPVLVGAVPSFDTEGYADLLHVTGKAGGRLPWNHRLLDGVTYAAGRLGLLPGWHPEEVSRRLGIAPAAYARHTAMGDATWVKDLLDVAVLDAARSPSPATRGA